MPQRPLYGWSGVYAIPNASTTCRLKSLNSGKGMSSSWAKAVCARSLSTETPKTVAPAAVKRE